MQKRLEASAQSDTESLANYCFSGSRHLPSQACPCPRRLEVFSSYLERYVVLRVQLPATMDTVIGNIVHTLSVLSLPSLAWGR